MKNIMTKHVVLIFLLLSSICYAEPRIRPDIWAASVIGTDLNNLYRVDEGIFRSEQPGDDDVTDLKALGIQEVLNLRELHSDNDELAGSGFKLHRVKMNAGDVAEKDIIEALRIVKHSRGPILIHCWHGSDRTGVVVAAYRIIFNNWSKSQALDEMVNGGYGYHEKIYPDLVELIKRMDEIRIRKALKM